MHTDSKHYYFLGFPRQAEPFIITIPSSPFFFFKFYIMCAFYILFHPMVPPSPASTSVLSQKLAVPLPCYFPMPSTIIKTFLNILWCIS
ncbi:hypothetical protein K435DRAFT_285318 [Dendrothele bispora CBS 962.96]|uniref:Uncharacterized protein n=1 Tax=Dendrothele bispora (strain CBS 962.96) TaxID=1314807 RepID=A0A4S8MKP3_DENBC|nr:hypothetical protein K435DRAFT_285318 [Dendrothele bispora CBS 962.96]